MLRFGPLTLLLALLALAVAAPQSAHAAAPSAKRCKAVKAKKHKTKRDRATLTACRKAEAKAKAAKKKAASQAATSKPAATTAPAPEAAVPTTSTPAPGATPTPTPTPTPAPTVPQIPAGSGRAVQVRGFEFGLNLSRTQVLPGSVRVEFNLASAEDPHTLILFREDGTGETYSFDEQPSGSVLAKSLQLSAGTWRLVCDLPEHAERGMQTTLRVG